MGIWIFYVFALLPLLVGAILWVCSRKVVWQEWACSAAAGFIFAAIMHAIAVHGMTDDTETWSGRIIQSREYSRWKEYYEYAVYRTEYYTTTDSKGQTTTHSRQVFDHWEPTTRWHEMRWECFSNIDTSYDIARDYHQYFEGKFKDRHTVRGDRSTWEHNSHMIAGDPNDYVADNHTNWTEPVTKAVSFENRVKACPSVFSYVKPAPGIVYPYPANSNPFRSDRLLGTALSAVNKFAWDQMNARLGPTKKVNVVMVGFAGKGSDYGQMQEAEWVGGKKNDIIITYGGPDAHPTWAHVFGWTEHDVVKRDLESIILNSGVATTTLPLIENEIIHNYALKDWKKFDYLTIEPPAKYYLIYIVILGLGNVGYWIWAMRNDFSK